MTRLQPLRWAVRMHSITTIPSLRPPALCIGPTVTARRAMAALASTCPASLCTRLAARSECRSTGVAGLGLAGLAAPLGFCSRPAAERLRRPWLCSPSGCGPTGRRRWRYAPPAACRRCATAAAVPQALPDHDRSFDVHPSTHLRASSPLVSRATASGMQQATASCSAQQQRRQRQW